MNNATLTLEQVEKAHILMVLAVKNDNRTHTARALNIGIRTLQRKLKKYGVPLGNSRSLEVKETVAIVA